MPDPSFMSQPYVLGGLAVLFYAGCMLLNPWRGRMRAAWKFTREYPLFWFVIGLVGAHQGWWLERKEKVLFDWPHDFSPAFASELIPKVAWEAGNSVVSALVLPLVAEPLSVILALAMFLNVGDTGLALRRGCLTAFPKRGAVAFVVLMMSAAANISWLACVIGGWLPESSVGMKVLHGMGILWSGATVAFTLGWLVRLAETHFYAPEEVLQIAWPASAAGRIPRLWPVVLGAGAVQLWSLLTVHNESSWTWSVRIAGWLLVAGVAFLPLLLVHWRGDLTWRAAFRESRFRFFCHWPRLVVWVAVAFTHFFLYHLAQDGVSSGLPANSIWRMGWEFLSALLHAALVVWLLASWVAFQPKFQISKTNFAQEPNPDT